MVIQDNKEIQCPECGKMVPANHKFCFNCGAKIEAPKPEPQPTTTPKPEPQPAVTPKPTPKPEPKPSIPEEDDDDEDEYIDDDATNGSRKWAITVALVLIVAILSGIILYSSGIINPTADSMASDSVHSAITEMAPADALNTFINITNEENKNADGALTAYAAFTHLGNRERIVGVTYLTRFSQQSSFKVITLERTNGSWQSINEVDRFADGRITMDRNELRLAMDDVPRFIDLNNRSYFYFVYLVSPFENTASADYHLMFCLYDFNVKEVVQLDFTCREYMRDGERYFRGDITTTGSSAELDFLRHQAENADIIYRPSEEELALERPENADKRWINDNATNLARVDSVGSANLVFNYYDKPLFTKDDVISDSRTGNDDFIFIASPKGIVYGYNRHTDKYFVAYVANTAEAPALEMQGSHLRIATTIDTLIINPTSHRISVK